MLSPALLTVARAVVVTAMGGMGASLSRPLLNWGDDMEENEKLVARIQDGEDRLMLRLWENAERFVKWRANRLIYALGGRYGVEVGDLVSAGYLAIVKAAKTYDAESGAKFITWFNYHLSNAFAEACGFRTSKEDTLNSCLSLDAQLDASDPDGDTLLDVQPDPRSSDGYDAVDRLIYNEQLQRVLDAALSELPEAEADAIRLAFFTSCTEEEAAARLDVKRTEFHSLKNRGLTALRTGKQAPVLREFNFYSGVSFHSWKKDRMSVEERYVIMKDQRERRERHDQDHKS